MTTFPCGTRKFFICFFLIISFFGVGSSFAQESDEKDWEINLAPYLLITNLNGTSTLGPISGPIDLSFKDILENFEFGFSVHAEARKNRIGLITDLTYIKLGSATDLSEGASISSGVEILLFEAFGFYRVSHQNSDSKIDIYAGLRLWDLKFDTSFIVDEMALQLRNTPSWVDPVIGIRTIQRLSPKWTIIVRGDIGGFGVASDFAWTIQGSVAWKTGKTGHIVLGYKYQKTDYNNGITGVGAFAYDAAMHGVFIGYNFSFGSNKTLAN